jgi:hypothetical protein
MVNHRTPYEGKSTSVIEHYAGQESVRLNNEDLVKLEKFYVLAEQPEELQNGAQT